MLVYNGKEYNKNESIELLKSMYNTLKRNKDHKGLNRIFNATYNEYQTLFNDAIIFEVKSYKTLLKLVKKDITDLQEFEEYGIELFSNDSSNLILEYSKELTLSKSDYYYLSNIYGSYEGQTIEQTKLSILYDALIDSINNNNSSYTTVKNNKLKEVKDILKSQGIL